MKMFNRKAVTVAVALAAMSAVGAAQAATLSAQQGGGTYSYTGAGQGNYDFVFDKFDTALGTLTSVQVVYSIGTTAGTSGEADNESAASTATGNYEFRAANTMSVLTGGVLLLDNAFGALGNGLATDAHALSLGLDDGDGGVGNAATAVQVGGTDYAAVTSLAANDTTGSGFINSGFINAYAGTGQTFSLRAATTLATAWIGTGTVSQASGPLFLNTNIDVIYTYTVAAVPEPSSSLGLMVAGLMGFGAYRRRKSTKAA